MPLESEMNSNKANFTRRNILLSSVGGAVSLTAGCNIPKSDTLEESVELTATYEPETHWVYSGEVATVYADIENLSNTEFAEEVTLEVYGKVRDSREVVIPPNEEKRISLEWDTPADDSGLIEDVYVRIGDTLQDSTYVDLIGETPNSISSLSGVILDTEQQFDDTLVNKMRFEWDVVGNGDLTFFQDLDKNRTGVNGGIGGLGSIATRTGSTTLNFEDLKYRPRLPVNIIAYLDAHHTQNHDGERIDTCRGVIRNIQTKEHFC